MSGNSFGKNFIVTTAGESHGAALVAIIDGCPPGLNLSESDLQPDLDRRRPGQSRHTTQRDESDQVEILSGVFEGKTTGTPIALLIKNEDMRSRDYSEIKAKFRPGHADYVYEKKYGIRDYRGGGRASARETAMRVAAGSIAKKYLSAQGIAIQAYVRRIGEIGAETLDLNVVETNPFFFPDISKIEQLEKYIHQLRRDGDSVGALVEVVATGMPIGLGEPVFDKLSADIAKALMSINAAKAVAIGDGFDVVSQRGSEHRDQMDSNGFISNHAGGILGGISNGEDVIASVAFKPTSSIITPGKTQDKAGNVVDIVTKGRHDPCVGIRAVPIVEAMLALVLIDHMLRDRGQTGGR